jgi:hypothetical protein
LCGALLVLPVLVPAAVQAQNAQVQNAAPAANVAAGALELRQKWVAGQQLVYDVALNGTVSMQASPNVPSMFAGIPMDIDVAMDGQSTLDTIAVNEQGLGTVAVRLNRLRLNADSFGQKAVFTVADGRAVFTMNGQRFGGAGMDATALTNPTSALQISHLGRLTGMVPVPGANAAPAPTNRQSNGQAARGAMPFDPTRFAQSAFWRVIPNLWPETPVKAGDHWSTPVIFPKEAIKGAAAGAATDLDLGKFNFTLRGEEAVAGRRALRVSVEGNITVNERAVALMQGPITPPAAAPAAQANAAGQRNPRVEQRLAHATQKVAGDVWFDAAAGQVIRLELNLETQAASRDILPAGFKGKRVAKKNPNDPDSWLDFTGVLQMQLKNVSQKAAANS